MLLRITVLQYKGAPPATALAYMFDERGGSIGRENCDLTLPDEARILSRVQAQITFADGLFSLIDQGGNPSIVNSLRVGKGLSRPLYDGDILELCDYKLRVKAIGVKAGGDTTAPMRANDPMPPQELVPPILLDPDELTNAPVREPTFAQPAIRTIAPEAELEVEFDMDFDDLDASGDIHGNDPAATVSMSDVPGVSDYTAESTSSSHETAQANVIHAESTVPTVTPEPREPLSALCLGLGVHTPPDILPPQHVGILMRRSMQQAIAAMIGNCTAEQLKQAQDNFHSLFDSEFLKACDAQRNRLREHN